MALRPVGKGLAGIPTLAAGWDRRSSSSTVLRRNDTTTTHGGEVTRPFAFGLLFQRFVAPGVFAGPGVILSRPGVLRMLLPGVTAERDAGRECTAFSSISARDAVVGASQRMPARASASAPTG